MRSLFSKLFLAALVFSPLTAQAKGYYCTFTRECPAVPVGIEASATGKTQEEVAENFATCQDTSRSIEVSQIESGSPRLSTDFSNFRIAKVMVTNEETHIRFRGLARNEGKFALHINLENKLSKFYRDSNPVGESSLFGNKSFLSYFGQCVVKE